MGIQLRAECKMPSLKPKETLSESNCCKVSQSQVDNSANTVPLILEKEAQKRVRTKSGDSMNKMGFGVQRQSIADIISTP